jgi:small subunit ribosomal protein S16
MGKIRNPQYRIVVADSRTKRDGRAIEYVGIYQPKEHPSIIQVKSERVQYWLSVGAQPSEAVQRLLEKTGDWQQFKGLPAPPPLLMKEEKVSHLATYEAEAKAAAGVVEPTTKQAAKKKAEPKADKAEKADKPKVDVEKALAETQAPQEEPKVTEGSVRDEPHAVAEGADAPKAENPVAPKVTAADTREEAAAKAEDPAGAGAGNEVRRGAPARAGAPRQGHRRQPGRRPGASGRLASRQAARGPCPPRGPGNGHRAGRAYGQGAASGDRVHRWARHPRRHRGRVLTDAAHRRSHR